MHTLAESRGGPRESHTGTEDPARPDQSVYPPRCCLAVLAKGKCVQMWRGMYGVPCSTSLHKELVLLQTCLRPASISLLPQASWYPSDIPEQSLKLVSIKLVAQNPAPSNLLSSGTRPTSSPRTLDPEISLDAGFSSNPTLPLPVLNSPQIGLPHCQATPKVTTTNSPRRVAVADGPPPSLQTIHCLLYEYTEATITTADSEKHPKQAITFIDCFLSRPLSHNRTPVSPFPPSLLPNPE